MMMRTRESGAAKLRDNVRVNFRRSGKIKQAVATDVLRGFQFRETLGKLRVSFRVGVISGTVIKIGGELVPPFRIDGPDFRNALGRIAQGSAKGFFGHGGTREADDHVARPQGIVNRQIVHRGNDFALGQIARGAEENYGTRLNNAPVHRTGTTRIRSHGFALRQVVCRSGTKMQRPKLYLNPILSKLRTQLIGVLMVNGVHPEAARAFEIERPVINKKTLLGTALGDLQSHAKDGFFRLAGTHITRAEEDQKVSSKIEGLNAVLV